MIRVRDFSKPGVSDSQAVTAALAQINERENTLLFDGGDFMLDEAVVLPDDTTVIVDGCTIGQNDFVFDNHFRGANCVPNPADPFNTPYSVVPTRGIRILGKNGATLRGPVKHRRMFHPFFKEEQEMVGDFWGWRSHVINLTQCRDFEIAGFKIRQQRNWAFCFDFCLNGFIHDIDFDSHVKNGDGIDFRWGCHHCKVKHITGYTQDDTVACTALDTSSGPGSKNLFPSEASKHIFRCFDIRKRDIHDIEIEDLCVSGRYHAAICLAGSGVQVYNITIRNVKEGTQGPRRWPMIELYPSSHGNYGTGYRAGDIHDIRIENVSSVSAPGRGMEGNEVRFPVISCLADMRNVVIRNVSQLGDGEVVTMQFPEGISIVN